MKWRKAVLAVLVAAALIGALVLVWWMYRQCHVPVGRLAIKNTNSIGCFEFWLNRYQTLVAGAAALLAALLTIKAMRDQMLHAEQLARHSEMDAEEVLRDYLREHLKTIAELWLTVDWILNAQDRNQREARAQATYHLLDRLPNYRVSDELESLVAQIRLDRRLRAKQIAGWTRIFYEFKEKNAGKSPVSDRLAILRIFFSHLERHVTAYDASLGTIFNGCTKDVVDHTPDADQIRQVREAIIADEQNLINRN